MVTIFSEGYARAVNSQLIDIVPKREVLYVGGRYMNITACCDLY